MINQASTENCATDQSIEWFARLRAEDVTKEERLAFLKWLTASTENQREYVEIVNLWEGAKLLDFEKLQRTIAANEPENLNKLIFGRHVLSQVVDIDLAI